MELKWKSCKYIYQKKEEKFYVTEYEFSRYAELTDRIPEWSTYNIGEYTAVLDKNEFRNRLNRLLADDTHLTDRQSIKYLYVDMELRAIPTRLSSSNRVVPTEELGFFVPPPPIKPGYQRNGQKLF